MARALNLPVLKKFSRLISQAVPRSSFQHLTVLCVGDQWLKALHVSGRGSARKIDAVIAQPIAGVSDEEILNGFRALWVSRGLEPGDVLVANPSPLTTVRLFTLPSIDPKEIREIVELQAEKHTPYAKEEILTDFLVIERNRAGYSRVLVIISHQDVVHRGLRLVEGMGWPLDRVGLETEGLAGWFKTAQTPAAAGGTLLVAELDSDTTVTVVLHDGKPTFHRSLALGTRQLAADPEQGPAKLVGELQRTLEAFEAEGLNLKVGRVLLTGQAVRFPALPVQIQQGLDLPAAILSSMERCPLTDSARKESEALPDVSFASLTGLALLPSEADLTPRALKLQRTFEVRSKALVKVGCQLIAGLLMMSCLLVGKAYQDERARTVLREQDSRIGGEAALLASLTDQIRTVQEWQQLGDQLLGSVVDLYENAPSGILWREISFTRGAQVVLKGVSPETPQVFDFVAELEKLPRFSKVEARRTTRKKVDEQDVTEFEIVGTFK